MDEEKDERKNKELRKKGCWKKERVRVVEGERNKR